MSRLTLSAPQPTDPLESWHQETFFYTAALHLKKHPELKFLAAVPNGGFRHKATAEAMKRQGVKRGVPDTFLPMPRGGYCGWWGELKRYGGTPSDVSPEQREWLAFLKEQGYYAESHKGWEKMWQSLIWYLSLPPASPALPAIAAESVPTYPPVALRPTRPILGQEAPDNGVSATCAVGLSRA